jgi:hypothetical protein
MRKGIWLSWFLTEQTEQTFQSCLFNFLCKIAVTAAAAVQCTADSAEKGNVK